MIYFYFFCSGRRSDSDAELTWLALVSPTHKFNGDWRKRGFGFTIQRPFVDTIHA